MSSTDDQGSKIFLIRIANLIRSNYTSIEDNPRYKKKKVSFLSHLSYSTSPLLFSSFVSYPLYFLRNLIQTNHLRTEKFESTKAIFNYLSNKGIKSYWTGCKALSISIFLQSILRYSIYDRVKIFYKRSIKNTSQKKLSNLMSQLLSGLTSGFITSLITYPYDLACNRISSSVKHSYRSYNETFLQSTNVILNTINKYSAFKYALLEGSVNGMILFTIYSSYISYKSILPEGKNAFVVSSVIGFISSILTYPLNTIKKFNQLNNFNDEFMKYDYKKVKYSLNSLYQGVHLHMIRTMFIGYIQINVFNYIQYIKMRKSVN